MIVDAIGVTKSLKTASQPLITKPTVPLKDLATGVMMGVRDEDTVSSLAGRLARLNKQLDDKDQAAHQGSSGRRRRSTEIVRGLVDAIDPDRIEARPATAAAGGRGADRRRSAIRPATSWSAQAANVFTGALINLLDGIRREKEQTIDHDNLDTLLEAGWERRCERERASAWRKDFAAYLEEQPRRDRGADHLLQPAGAAVAKSPMR